jgi:biofilm protein TabA
MIADKIENIDTYRGIHENVDKAIEYLLKEDFVSLSPGKHQIHGDDLFIIISEYTTKPKSESQYEAHRKYIDIQILIKGEENIYWLPVDGLNVSKEYSEETDAALFEEASGSLICMERGYFALFFPKDAHMPGCSISRNIPVKKAVVKVRI